MYPSYSPTSYEQIVEQIVLFKIWYGNQFEIERVVDLERDGLHRAHDTLHE